MKVIHEFPYYVPLSKLRIVNYTGEIEEIANYAYEIITILQQNFHNDCYSAFFNSKGVYFKHASDAVRFKLMCG